MILKRLMSFQRKTEDTKQRLWLAYGSFAVNPAGISDDLPDSLDLYDTEKVNDFPELGR